MKWTSFWDNCKLKNYRFPKYYSIHNGLHHIYKILLHGFGLKKGMQQRLRMLLTVLPPGYQLAWPAVAEPLAGTMEWMEADKWSWLVVFKLWLLNSANQNWVMLQRPSIWSVSFCQILLPHGQRDCTCDDKRLSIYQTMHVVLKRPLLAVQTLLFLR